MSIAGHLTLTLTLQLALPQAGVREHAVAVADPLVRTGRPAAGRRACHRLRLGGSIQVLTASPS